MSDSVDDLLAGPWRAHQARQRKVLEYIQLTLVDLSAHTVEKHLHTQETECAVRIATRCSLLLSYLLDEQPDQTARLEEAVKGLWGLAELRSIQAAWRKLYA